MNTDYIIVFITAPGIEEGKKIGKALVEERLAACANIVPGITSIYRWEGKLESSDEVLLIIKTMKNFFEELKERTLRLHPYSVPEIVAFPIIEGNPSYLKWINESLSV